VDFKTELNSVKKIKHLTLTGTQIPAAQSAARRRTNSAMLISIHDNR
jgi:hypothetical protein